MTARAASVAAVGAGFHGGCATTDAIGDKRHKRALRAGETGVVIFCGTGVAPSAETPCSHEARRARCGSLRKRDPHT